MGRRTLLLLTSLLIAAVGTALVALYVRGADQRALEKVESTEVLMASRDIPANTSASRLGDYIKVAEVFRGQVAEGSTLETNTQLTQLRDWVTDARVVAGQVLDKRMFRAPGDSSSVTSVIDADKMMISVQMADQNRVAAYIQPNAEVAVFLTQGAVGTPERQTKVLIPRIKVVAVGSPAPTGGTTARTGAGSEESVPTTVVTLQADQASAQRLILAQTSGEMYFTLLGPQATPDQTKETREKDL
jgi:pilus assembly protein CpaB